MQLAILIAVICALAHGQEPGEPVGGALWRAALGAGGMLMLFHEGTSVFGQGPTEGVPTSPSVDAHSIVRRNVSWTGV